ncbi:hypothetical protein NDU88_003555 [Pleurodeles waltl]|uniref:Uncharacterized protein n=1 Tax=Pleurodeles waltl TaxID=8319 RepID=A0AAV7TNX3_PLEWA|nr:hypothetical protein NDU88_003555 [Pleurodeles waltl]
MRSQYSAALSRVHCFAVGADAAGSDISAGREFKNVGEKKKKYGGRSLFAVQQCYVCGPASGPAPVLRIAPGEQRKSQGTGATCSCLPPMGGAQAIPLRQVASGEGRCRHRESPAGAALSRRNPQVGSRSLCLR